METLRVTSDKYGRQLSTIYIDSDTPVDIDNYRGYMAVLMVSVNENGAMKSLRDIARRLSEKKVFTIAIFITNQYDWTFCKSLDFGIKTWLTATSTEEAESIASDFIEVITSNAPIALDLADVKTILYNSEGRRFYYGTGSSNDNNLKIAIEKAVEKAKETGMDVNECSKYLFAFNSNPNMTMAKLNDVDNLINELSDKHNSNFEFKWGLLSSVDKNESNYLKFAFIAAH